MKISKQDLLSKVEEYIAAGVISCEEVDVTASNIVAGLWPIIVRMQDEQALYMRKESDTRADSNNLRLLFKKYIEHVISMEGVDFINASDLRDTDIRFTKREIGGLLKLKKEMLEYGK